MITLVLVLRHSIENRSKNVIVSHFVSIRYLTLKQILPQLEQFESGFEDELKWLEDALVALEAYKNVNTLEEVEGELGRYTVSRRSKRKVKYHK